MAVKAVAHVKSATAVAVVKAKTAAMPKAKPPSTTTPHPKLKPKRALKHAMNAWPAKSAAKAPKPSMATNLANLAVIVLSVAKVKAVVSAPHVASAMKVKAAANAPLA